MCVLKYTNLELKIQIMRYVNFTIIELYNLKLNYAFILQVILRLYAII